MARLLLSEILFVFVYIPQHLLVFVFVFQQIRTFTWQQLMYFNGKGKAVPLQAWSGPERSRKISQIA
jgi:hypothetical protein